MRSLPRWTNRRQPSDGIPPHAIPPHAIPAPRRREPSAPLFGLPDRDEAYVPRYLPPENGNLLTAYPAADGNAFLAALAMAAAARAAGHRPGCRILATSAAFEYEAAVGQNLAMLADQEHPAVTR